MLSIACSTIFSANPMAITSGRTAAHILSRSKIESDASFSPKKSINSLKTPALFARHCPRMSTWRGQIIASAAEIVFVQSFGSSFRFALRNRLVQKEAGQGPYPVPPW